MSSTVLSAREARSRILDKKCRGPITVEEKLDLSGEKSLTSLPRGLVCYELDASDTPLRKLPADMQVECRLTLRNCHELQSLPDNLTVGTLDLRGSSAITKLPEGLSVWFLDVGDCRNLSGLPERACIENGGLSIRGCEQLGSLPDYLLRLATLDVSDCPQITALPRNLKIGLWVDIGGSGITRPLPQLHGVGLRWRGVAIDTRIAFRPDSLSADEALRQSNTELRRVMIERMGMERFLAEAKVKVLDSDRDAGGPRKLLRVPLKDDEDIVCLCVQCPSTGRQYMLRVPPDMTGCHQAAAWMAGFSDPKKYQPVIET